MNKLPSKNTLLFHLDTTPGIASITGTDLVLYYCPGGVCEPKQFLASGVTEMIIGNFLSDEGTQ